MKKLLAGLLVVLCATVGWAQTIVDTITSPGDVMVVNTSTFWTAGVQITGTWVGTLEFEASVDQTNFVSVSTRIHATWAAVQATQTNGMFYMPIQGQSQLRIRASVWTSGTAVVNVFRSIGEWPGGMDILSGVPQPPFAVTLSEPIDVTIVGGGSVATITREEAHAEAALGMAVFRRVSAASTNSAGVKGSAGSLYGWYLTNTGLANRYVKIYDTASAPTCGSGTPVLTLALPGGLTGLLTGSGWVTNVHMNPPIAFHSGIGLCITGGAADGDVSAVGANEVVVNLTYKD